ncbi:MAG: hydrogenase expression/formation protein HypE [Alphaproteobacteria bacterium]|nr:hydrogenase expression/formation protein HypE [Alphaproteobacteria bacterium]
MTRADAFNFACSSPLPDRKTVQLAHGGGGRAMKQLIDEIVRPSFQDPELDRGHDGALLDVSGPLAFTTDSYVVRPLFFPGGDIGSLAVNGTVNDLAMCGARPLYFSVGLILEEGLPIDTLRRVAASMRDSADAAGVRLVTGDTKVVDRGKMDGMFINTAGVGKIVAPSKIGPESVRPGDAVIVSGDIGRHGIAVMTAREGFEFETPIASDCAPLAAPVLALIDAGIATHCLRDLTRGGLASAAVEIAETSGLAIALEEQAVPVCEEVKAACELFGFDPLHVANEGRFIAFVPQEDAARTIEILRRWPVCKNAAIIGVVEGTPRGRVSCRGPLGVRRAVDMLSGEQLPRIC